jgi:hypothetical protein
MWVEHEPNEQWRSSLLNLKFKFETGKGNMQLLTVKRFNVEQCEYQVTFNLNPGP